MARRVGVAHQGGAETIADLLGRGRAGSFVGRAAERTLFGEVLSGESDTRLVWIHGPGGVGKSSLLKAFQRHAAGLGTSCVDVDFSSIEPRPDVFLRELSAHGWSGAIEPALVSLDTFERAAALEPWLQEEWLPSLPSTAVVVVAGRRPPGARWTGDEGWRQMLGEIRLRNFSPEETSAYLRGRDVPASNHAAVAMVTHGHPLALSLVADLARHGSPATLTRLDAAPDLVDELVRRLVESIPDAVHRRALQVCAHAWVTTEDLLREVLEVPDAGDLMSWLRNLSIVESGPYGVFPHDLARDAIDADLRWRDPASYADLHRRVQRASVLRATQVAGAEQQRAILQVVHAHRHSSTAAFWDYSELGAAYLDALRPEDTAHLLDMTRRHQGEEQAGLVAHWIERQPDAFRLVRTAAAEPVGFAAMLRLDRADATDLARDPAARATVDAIERQRPARPGEHTTMMRFFIDAERNQSPSRTLNLGPVLSIQTLLADPAIGWDVLCWIDSGAMDPLMEFIDYQRLSGGEHRIGSTEHAVFGRDFRRRPLAEWFDLLADRELGEPVAPPSRDEGDLLALSYDEFAASVGQALKDLHRRDRLAANPLCRSRLVAEGSADEDPVDRLTAAVRHAATTLGEHPREAPLARALDRTYLRPAPTQEAAAEVLGLPFSTYRRHLTRGVQRAVEVLWQRELGGQEVSRNRSGE